MFGLIVTFWGSCVCCACVMVWYLCACGMGDGYLVLVERKPVGFVCVSGHVCM